MSITEPPTTYPSLIEIENVSFAYEERVVIENVSLTISEQDFIALIGSNGSGKTTLIKLMIGALRPNSGVVKRHIPTRRIGYVPQHIGNDHNFPATVSEILDTADTKIIEELKISALLSQKFIKCSSGQQQRVLIALALLQRPRLLILDEPTAGIDINAKKIFYALLARLHERGIAVILITHEIAVLPSVIKQVVCIDNKRCYRGPPHRLPGMLTKIYGEYALHDHIH